MSQTTQLAAGSYTYTPSLDEALTEAWERCGKSPSVLNGDVLRSARRSIQLMLIDWTNEPGPNLWQVPQISLLCTPGTSTIPLTPEIVDVINAIVTDATGTDYIMTPLSRDDYISIPVKATSGRPSQFWVERVLPSPIIHLYPAPDQSYSITAWLMRQPQDVLGMGGTADVPLLWAEALAAGLAARLAVKFAPDRAQLLKADAAEALMKARGENRERAPLRILPRTSRR